VLLAQENLDDIITLLPRQTFLIQGLKQSLGSQIRFLFRQHFGIAQFLVEDIFLCARRKVGSGRQRPSQTHAFLFIQHVLKTADRLALIAEQGIVDAAQFFRSFSMTFQRIDADTEDFGVLGANWCVILLNPATSVGQMNVKSAG